jgi:hypothetical protein
MLRLFLLAGYAVFLMAAASVLELVARHTHRRSDRYRNSGFVFSASWITDSARQASNCCATWTTSAGLSTIALRPVRATHALSRTTALIPTRADYF